MKGIKNVNKNRDLFICGGCDQICFNYHICENCNVEMCVDNCTRKIAGKPENYCKDCYYTM